jgi:hypothetical protein
MTTTTQQPFQRLKEGKSYPFRITGIVVLPDGSEYFALSDPNLVKHLLEKKYYENYFFETGQLIECRIDKINCSGKIYIEPLHPLYKVGRRYEFPFVKFTEGSNRNGSIETWAVFEDVFGNEIKIPWDFTNGGGTFLPIDMKPGDMVKLTVIRIKKGQVYVSDTNFDGDFKVFKKGVEYPFIIAGYRNFPGKQGYFILRSPGGSNYKLRSKFYEKYNLAVGQTVYCRMIREGKDTYLEPRHPFYSIGSRYELEITGMGTIREYPQGQKASYLLRNDFGKEIILPLEEVGDAKPLHSLITCKVTGIRKGRVHVESL